MLSRDVLLVSYGEAFGPAPQVCCFSLSVKKSIENPPKRLRVHNGTNADLRRHVIEHASPAVLENIVARFRSALESNFSENDGFLIFVAFCLRQHLPPSVYIHVLDFICVETLVLGVGCVKGQHRSVSVVEYLSREKKLAGIPSLVPYRVVVRHRELEDSGKREKVERKKHKDRKHR
jgi:hypothetical protein